MFYLRILRQGFGASGLNFGPQWLGLLSVLDGGSVVVDSLFIVAPVCVGSVFGPCSVEQCLMSFSGLRFS